ncbi:bromodomain-containing protein [Scytonema sp. NUACC26]|uniref:bromodomain-containing protein n=1 Tax=Scytonema sp. NUACC26 TaxID=3140176 RepID=UPI0034DCC3DC
MDFKYRWKDGRQPTRDRAATSDSLLDKGQFSSKKDWQMAEQDARKRLGVPAKTIDADRSVLPHAPSTDSDDSDLL